MRSRRARTWACILLAASSASALSACAAIIGVEDVQLRDGGDDAGADNADGDAGAADSGDAD
ncbi:MAG: hypothetical protein FWD69_07930 [Polyangiaceae bacterium]|nr:hypothetical protein [Polyangiaceae bacterium]